MSGRILTITLALLCLPASEPGTRPAPPSSKHDRAARRLPPRFEPNVGQFASAVSFVMRGAGYSALVMPAETVFVLAGRTRLRMKLAGANESAPIRGENRLPGTSSYFIGNDPRQWRKNVPQYASTRVESAWPGIDVVFHGDQGRMEFDF